MGREQVPLNNWLPYLSQLQTSLQRPEAGVVKDLLSQLATAFPHAVYYGLRTILLSLREVGISVSYSAPSEILPDWIHTTPSLLHPSPALSLQEGTYRQLYDIDVHVII